MQDVLNKRDKKFANCVLDEVNGMGNGIFGGVK